MSINSFFVQAHDASGNPIAANSGNDDWIIALVVVIIVILLLVFFYMRRNRKTTPPTAAMQASSAPPGVHPESAARFCQSCGAPVEPDAKFCP